MKKELTTITRSFSLKVNLGNYESADFFACQSAEVELDIAEETSEQLYSFVKKEVVKSRNEFMKEREDIKNFNDPNYYQNAEKAATDKFPNAKKEFVKPWQQQMKKTMREAEEEFMAKGGSVYDPNAPVYEAGSRDGGKVLVDKLANTLEPI